MTKEQLISRIKDISLVLGRDWQTHLITSNTKDGPIYYISLDAASPTFNLGKKDQYGTMISDQEMVVEGRSYKEVFKKYEEIILELI